MNEKVREKLRGLSKINDSLVVQAPITGTSIDDNFQIFTDFTPEDIKIPFAVYSYSELDACIENTPDAEIQINEKDKCIVIKNDVLTTKYILSSKDIIEYPTEPSFESDISLQFNLSKNELQTLKKALNVYKEVLTLKIEAKKSEDIVVLSIDDYSILVDKNTLESSKGTTKTAIISDYLSMLPDDDYLVSIYNQEGKILFESSDYRIYISLNQKG